MAPEVRISSAIFEAFLHCQMKAYLLIAGASGAATPYQRWHMRLNSEYDELAIKHLTSKYREIDGRADLPSLNDLLNEQPNFILTPEIVTPTLTSYPLALLRTRNNGNPQSLPYAPVRCARSKKSADKAKLLLAFDGLVLSRYTGRRPASGLIVQGPSLSQARVSLSPFAQKVEKIVGQIELRQELSTSPPLQLCKHCEDCAFQERCRKVAIEKDDISLLPSIGEKERQRFATRGIFTITQLSYTYRSKRMRAESDKRPQNNSALRALAIRKNVTHVIGSVAFEIPPTAVYIDVEGSEDAQFYYLIGLRHLRQGEVLTHSFWADHQADEVEIWRQCVRVLASLENPTLIHYGSYEVDFLRSMKRRCCRTREELDLTEKLLSSSINLLKIVYAKIYFPTYSNALKQVAKVIGFKWSDPQASGRNALSLRAEWELSHSRSVRHQLETYNQEDCEAAQRVAECIKIICAGTARESEPLKVVDAGNVEREFPRSFGALRSALPEFDSINKAAYWDYQRNKVYVRTNGDIRRSLHNTKKQETRRSNTISKTIPDTAARPSHCNHCGSHKIYKNGHYANVAYNLKIMSTGIRRSVERNEFISYSCWDCKRRQRAQPPRERYGSGLTSYIVYQLIELRMSQRAVCRHLSELFKISITDSTMQRIKSDASIRYQSTYERILQRIRGGDCIHADETRIKKRGGTAYVWAFTSQLDSAYVFSEGRNASTPKKVLAGFSGVLVSDFYAAYEAIDCKKQRCLIHLMRDINEDILRHPFNPELEWFAKGFASLLSSIVRTVDRHGLKARFLRRHNADVVRFFDALALREFRTDVAAGYKKRMERNRECLFTFLDHDGVPWNNNNAEHAIKALADLRGGFGPNGTQKSIQEYLVLLSVFESCRFRGIRFLSFLRSGASDLLEASRY